MAEEWLFPLLLKCAGTAVSTDYILIIARSTHKALAKRILELPGMPANMQVHFCLQREFRSGSISFQLPSNLNVFINISTIATPSWLAARSRKGVLQFDFFRNNFRTLYHAMYKNYLPTVVHGLLMQPSGVESCIALLQFKTIDYSIRRQIRYIKNAVYETLPSMVAEVTTGLFRCNRQIEPEDKKEHFFPGIYFLQMLAGIRYFAKQFRVLFQHYKWNIGLINMPIQELLEEPSDLPVQWMNEEGGLDFAADPFALEENGSLRIFYEKFDHAGKRGQIESVLYNKGFGTKSPAIGAGVHLSYPYIFHDSGRTYMVPESSEASSIDLYEYKGGNWQKQKTIIPDFKGVDPTVIRWEGKWWLFCTNKKNKGADIRLHIFFSDAPQGPWLPHLLNPVKTSICSARPAGTPFIRNNRLFRPAQDSSHSYGRRIVIHEVIKLDEKMFDEREVACLQPWQLQGIYRKGVHTIAACGNYTVVDGRRTIYSFANLLRFIRKR